MYRQPDLHKATRALRPSRRFARRFEPLDRVNGGLVAWPAGAGWYAYGAFFHEYLARRFEAQGWPILAFLDTHVPGKPEPPYPPHCEKGTGQEELVPELKWLEGEKGATLQRKDCINGFVGGIDKDGRNRVVDWVNKYKLEKEGHQPFEAPLEVKLNETVRVGYTLARTVQQPADAVDLGLEVRQLVQLCFFFTPIEA